MTHVNNEQENMCAVCLYRKRFHREGDLACPTNTPRSNNFSRKKRFVRLNTHCTAEYKLCVSFGIKEDGAELPSSEQVKNLRWQLKKFFDGLCDYRKGVDKLERIEIEHVDTYYG